MRRLLVLSLLVSLASCDTVAPPDGFEGTWEWTYTSHGHLDGPSPEDVGYDLSMTFEGGEYVLRRGTDLVNAGTYRLGSYHQEGTADLQTVVIRFYPFPQDDALQFYFSEGNGDGERLLATLSNSSRTTLHIMQPCLDCYGMSFVRSGP